MKYIKVITLSLGIVILSTLAFVGVAGATSFKSGESITVAANETINSMLFVAGNNINIAGTVNGDVYCAGQTITISGTINGDVICGGQTIIISGKVDGSVRLGGQTVTLSGTVGNSATIGAQDLVIDKSAVISRDLLGGSQNITINGKIGRDIVSGSRNLNINGQVGRNINGGVETLSVGSDGQVGGTVEYIGTTDPSIATGGKIVGKVTRTEPPKNKSANYVAPGYVIGWFVYVMLTTLVIALILAGLFPRVLNEAATAANKKPGQTVLVGIIAAIVVPVLIIMLMISIIGIPAAIIAILVWIVIIMISNTFAGYALGHAMLKNQKQSIWIILAGTSALTVTYFIPFIGFFTLLAAYLYGTGMILNQSKKLLVRSAAKK